MRDGCRSFPFPVAHALREVQRAHDAREHYAAVLKSAETLAITVCVCLTAVLRAHRAAPADQRSDSAGRGRDVVAMRAALLGRAVTFGTWTAWLGDLAQRAATYSALVPALNEALRDTGHTPGLVTCLNALREERNRAAHGDTPQSLPECAQRAFEAGYYLEAAVSKTAFLTPLPWLLIKSTDYRPGAQAFEVTTYHAMGDHPDFDLKKYRFSQPVGTDLFYLLDGDTPVLLSPLVASRYCPSCRSIEVCYAVHADPKTGPATLRSFNRGHDIEDLELADEIRDRW